MHMMWTSLPSNLGTARSFDGTIPIVNETPFFPSDSPCFPAPGEHQFDQHGNLILPPVAHGTPAQKRDALMDTILCKRLWVHFSRDAVRQVLSRGCTNPRAKMMLPIGILVDFRVPSASEGGLEEALVKYGAIQGEDLAVYLDMEATLIEFLKPHIDQVEVIRQMIAPYYQEPSGLTRMLAPSIPSTRAPSSQGQSSSGSEGFLTPARVAEEAPGEAKQADIGSALSDLLGKVTGTSG